MTLIGIVLIIISLGMMAFLAPLGTYAARLLENRIGAALHTEVRIGNVRVAAPAAIEFTDVAVMNPGSYEQGPALTVDRLRLDFELSSIVSRAPTIRSITIDGGTLLVHRRLAGGTNINALVEAALASAGNETTQKGRTCIVESLRVEGMRVRLRTDPIPIPVSMAMAPLTVDDLPERGALTVPEVSALVLRSLLSELLSLRGLIGPVEKSEEPTAAPAGQLLLPFI